MDDVLVRDMKKKGVHPADIKLLPEGGGWLLVEFGGETKDEADEKARQLMDRLKGVENPPSMKLFDDEAEEQKLWETRKSGLGATARIPGENDAWEGWEDAAVPPENVGPYLREFRKLLEKFGYACSLYGHFGQGCIHTRIDFDLKTYDGVKHYRKFLDEAGDLVVRHGGSISGEHGDGQSKAALLPKMFGDEIVRAFGEFKAIFDPTNKMNPHKVVDPYLPGENLRLGPAYNPPQVETHFKFPDDHGSFAYAMERCVGVGECRKEENGTMCPSYMVTREEMDSTRGRTHLLFEMLQGDPMKEGWRSDTVREALDLCLACKGCKTECPMNVDMATYKAEFLSHYYEGRLRPRHAYSMGLIYWWARLASIAPGVVNLITHLPVVGKAFQALGGISTRRNMPSFAPETFKAWWKRRAPRNVGKPRVILWPDTFNNHFHPQTPKAAVEVLEAAGFQVVVPTASLCCGRPLYDFGMLDTAKGLLREILDALRPEIEASTPVVGLEPSCVAVFRDELINLFPMDEDAKRLSTGTYILSEFLEKKAPNFRVPPLKRKALVQKHCHHDHVMGFKEEDAVLRKLGLDFEILNSGCCGMAGSFGFEAENYDVSVAVGERRLLPAVRKADDDTLIIADGFSCREQVGRPHRPGGPAPGAGPPDGDARGARRPEGPPARGGLSAPRQVGAPAVAGRDRRRGRPRAARGGRPGLRAQPRPGVAGPVGPEPPLDLRHPGRGPSPARDPRGDPQDGREIRGTRDDTDRVEGPQDRRGPGLRPQGPRRQVLQRGRHRRGRGQDPRHRRPAPTARIRRDAQIRGQGREDVLPVQGELGRHRRGPGRPVRRPLIGARHPRRNRHEVEADPRAPRREDLRLDLRDRRRGDGGPGRIRPAELAGRRPLHRHRRLPRGDPGLLRLGIEGIQAHPGREQVEVLSLIGDVALEDGEPKVHAHVVVGRSDGSTRGGHLIEARVRPTLEVILTESPAHLRKHHDPESGLALIRV